VRRDAEGRRLLLLAGLGAAVTAAAVVTLHRVTPRSFISAHGMLHTAIFQRFPSAGSLFSAPPENPFFAGEPLPYYWFYHYVAARVADLVSMSPLQAFEILGLCAVLIAWWSGASAGRALFGGVLPGFALGLFTFAGSNPFGAEVLALRFAVDGPSVLADNPAYLWGIAHPMLGLARYADPFSLYGPMLNFFLNVTSRPLSLALLVFIALAVFRYLQRSGRGWLLGIVIGATLCTALNPIIGLSAISALAAALCLAAWRPSVGIGAVPGGGEADDEGVPPHRWLLAAGGLAVGLLIALPTYLHLLRLTGGDTLRLEPSLRALKAVTASAGLLGAMGLFAAWRARGLTRRFLAAILVTAAVLMIAAVVMRLPVSNDSNFFHAASVLLGVPAAGFLAQGIGWRPKRRWIAWALLLLVFLPTPLVVLYSYLGRPAVALSMRDPVIRRVPETGPWARVYAWIREETAPDAVFITDPRPPLLTAVGNFPELPALTGRFLFTTLERNYVISPNRDAPTRERIATSLVDGLPLSAADESYLDGLARPLYLIREGEGAEGLAGEGVGSGGPPIFSADGIAVFAIRPRPSVRP